jgi:hypothetical protein
MSSIRGILATAGVRSQSELNSMSSEDHRNTIIVGLENLSNQPGSYFQTLNDAALARAGAVMFFLRESKIRSDDDLNRMSAEDHRNTLIVELNIQTQRPIPQLQALDNFGLVRLAGGEDNFFLRGVLISGGFRTQGELNQMSQEDHRNTLIVEMADHSNHQPRSFNRSIIFLSRALVLRWSIFVRQEFVVTTSSDS